MEMDTVQEALVGLAFVVLLAIVMGGLVAEMHIIATHFCMKL